MIHASQTGGGFKARLQRAENQTGLFLGLPSPAMVEMIAHAGFDFVIIDAEHGPAGTEMLEHLLRAAQACGLAGIVRVASSTGADILHALDAGAETILVPHVASAEAAAHIVAEAHFPPRGRRGISGLTRAARYGFVREHLAQRDAETSVIVMIEDVEALPHVAAIATTTDVDALFIGPADLAGSMGLAGEPRHPRVRAAIDSIIETTQGTGSAALVSTATDAADAARLQAAGVHMICFSAVGLFRDGLRALRAATRDTAAREMQPT